MSYERELADNRKLWDAWTAIHTEGEFYDVQRFRGDPADVRIEPWEREEVGDITGRTLLHVQCHFGLDTLSWARLGAAQVTGVDFSEPAIAFARELAAETGLADRSRFVVSNVYDLPGPLEGETFDVVYTGRGVYADPTADVDAEIEHGWNHSLGEIVTLLAAEGLRVELLDEKRTLDWPAPFLRDLGDGHWGWPEDQAGNLPLMYSLRARKDA
jgi:SAM-dependent methyltransferase